MIPVEAVEAAARKLCALAGYDWDNIDAPDDVATDFKAQVTAQARSVLEAAAPHLMAAAWDEGYMFSYDQERGGHGVGAIPIPEYLANDLAHWNPHRTSDA